MTAGMRQGCLAMLFVGWLFPGLATAGGNDSIPRDVDRVLWEHQNWESNGGYRRLTLWNDGRSEVEVVPLARVPAGAPELLPKAGWTVVQETHRIRFVRRNVYPPEVVQAKLRAAVNAGILQLESFRAGYLDGSGTRVVVRVAGRDRETVLPMFGDADRKTVNYQRFVAVSKVLDGFDADAFEVAK